MARRIYISNGTARRARTLYVGVNNAARRVTAAYIGVGGSARKIYPGSYLWNRYNVKSEYQYTPYVMSDTNIAFSRNAEFRQYSLITSYRTSVSNNTFLFILDQGDRIPNPDEIEELTNGTVFYAFEGWCYYIGTSSGQSLNEIRADFGLSSGASGQQMVQFTKISGTYGGTVNKKVWSSSRTTVYSQGSYIDQVVSDNRSAYPDNGRSGNYWYVYQGEA